MVIITLLLLYSSHALAHTDCQRNLNPPDVVTVAPKNSTDVVEIPIFSDVHGKIATLFQALAQLQQRENQTFGPVLIAGDLGAFPSPMSLSPSVRLAEIRSEEDLGFFSFLSEEKLRAQGRLPHRSLRQRFFDDAREGLKLQSQFYFVRGNHEDHDYLKHLEQRGTAILPLDPEKTFNYLADGRVIELLAPQGTKLRVASLGGIHAESRPGRFKQNPALAFDEAAINRLLNSVNEEPIDILLTHQGPDGTVGGHSEIRTLVEVLRPRLHLHGHADQFSIGTIDGTPTVGVPKLTSVGKHEGPQAVIVEWNVKTNELRTRTPF